MNKMIGKALVVVMSVMLLSSCTNAATNTQSSSGSSSGATKSGFDATKSISVVSREDGSGTRGAFIELFKVELKSEDGGKKDMTTKEAIISNKTDVMLTNISGDNYAIGYVSLGSLNDTVKALDVDATPASTENVKNGTYKISRPFMIATKDTVSEVAQDFISFILSKEGQEVVAKSYISVDDDAPAYSGSKPSGKITIAGSSSVSPIMEKLKEAYVAINANATIEIQMSDSTAGMTGAVDGTCDIGMASRSLKDSEKEKLSGQEIALDGIAVIVNNQNPLLGMTSEEIRRIFTGEIIKWNEIIK